MFSVFLFFWRFSTVIKDPSANAVLEPHMESQDFFPTLGSREKHHVRLCILLSMPFIKYSNVKSSSVSGWL